MAIFRRVSRTNKATMAIYVCYCIMISLCDFSPLFTAQYKRYLNSSNRMHDNKICNQLSFEKVSLCAKLENNIRSIVTDQIRIQIARKTSVDFLS